MITASGRWGEFVKLESDGAFSDHYRALWGLYLAIKERDVHGVIPAVSGPLDLSMSVIEEYLSDLIGDGLFGGPYMLDTGTDFVPYTDADLMRIMGADFVPLGEIPKFAPRYWRKWLAGRIRLINSMTVFRYYPAGWLQRVFRNFDGLYASTSEAAYQSANGNAENSELSWSYSSPIAMNFFARLTSDLRQTSSGEFEANGSNEIKRFRFDLTDSGLPAGSRFFPAMKCTATRISDNDEYVSPSWTEGETVLFRSSEAVAAGAESAAWEPFPMPSDLLPLGNSRPAAGYTSYYGCELTVNGFYFSRDTATLEFR